MGFFSKIFSSNNLNEDKQKVISTISVCPYCKKELEKTPLRKSKCPLCKETIYVKRGPEDKEKRLVTEEDAKSIEKEWQLKSFKDSIFYTVVNEYSSYKISSGEFDKMYKLEKSELEKKFNTFPKEGDILWGLSHKLIMETLKVGDLFTASALYRNMGFYLDSEGKDGSKLYFESAKVINIHNVQDCKKSGFKFVEIITAQDCCVNCKVNDGKIVSIKEALDILPCKECTHIYNKSTGATMCRCSVCAHFED